MAYLPLTFLRLVQGFVPGIWSGLPPGGPVMGCCDAVTGSGWSGRPGGRAAGGFEQVHPFGLAVPVFGQVQGDVASAVAGGPGGDGDEVAAQGGGPGPGEGQAGQ